jgi:hypothetical protein
MNIAIEDVSVIPTPVSRAPKLSDFPFAQLKVGQSFFIPNHQPSNRARPVPFAEARAAYPDRKFRRVPEEGGVRYGRTA